MTAILAKVLGLYILAFGIAFLINPDRFRKMSKQFMKDENLLLMGSIIALLTGAFIVGVHNYWVFGWPVIITLLGWWSLIKGFALIIYPGSLKFFSFLQNKTDEFYRFVSLFYILLGLFLIYMGLK